MGDDASPEIPVINTINTDTTNMEEKLYTVTGYIPRTPIATDVEATSEEEAREKARDQLAAEHGHRIELEDVTES